MILRTQNGPRSKRDIEDAVAMTCWYIGRLLYSGYVLKEETLNRYEDFLESITEYLKDININVSALSKDEAVLTILMGRLQRQRLS